MKKRIAFLIVLIVISLLCLAAFSGCEFLKTNDRSNVKLMATEADENGLYVYLNCYYGLGQTLEYTDGETFFYEFSTNKLSPNEKSRSITVPEIVMDGETSAHASLEVTEGYEPLLEQVQNFTIEGVEYPVYHALAFKEGDVVYGFCNVYSTAGFSCALDCKGISYSVLFTYDSETEQITVIERLEKSIVIAFDGKSVIWFNNKTYYGKNLGGVALEICKDAAYDSGLTNYSYAYFYFGGGYCMLCFHSDKGGAPNNKDNYDLYVLATMSGEKLAEYSQPLD